MTKKQHHVPQFILRKWIADGERGLKVYSKEKQQWLAQGQPVIRPEDICYKEWLYEHDGLQTNAIEKGYSFLEEHISRAYNKICTDKSELKDLTKFEQMALGYIPLMLTTRQPDVIETIDDSPSYFREEYPELYKSVSDPELLVTWGRLIVSGVAFGSDEIRKQNLAFLHGLYRSVWNTERVLWKCVKASGKGRFFETDQGFALTLVNKYDPYSVFLYTPLSPEKCLVTYPARYSNHIKAPKDRVGDDVIRVINDALYRSATDFVIFGS